MVHVSAAARASLRQAHLANPGQPGDAQFYLDKTPQCSDISCYAIASESVSIG